jgi:hypothetical protein
MYPPNELRAGGSSNPVCDNELSTHEGNTEEEITVTSP